MSVVNKRRKRRNIGSFKNLDKTKKENIKKIFYFLKTILANDTLSKLPSKKYRIFFGEKGKFTLKVSKDGFYVFSPAKKEILLNEDRLIARTALFLVIEYGIDFKTLY